MNLGSSKKWIEIVNSQKFPLNDGVGLRWEDSFSLVGVLEDFITREWKHHESMGYMNLDGNLNIASKDCLKKTKAKTNLEMVDDFLFEFKCQYDAREVSCRLPIHKLISFEFGQFITEKYEVL